MVYPLITLYSPTETEFKTNGLGSLSEASSCSVVEVANGEFELEMVYPVTGRRYKDLVNRAIIYAKPNPIDPPQPFRIYEISRPMNGLVTFYAAHISYDLSGYPIKPFTAENAQAAMLGLKNNAVVNHPFTFWTDKAVNSTFTVDTPISTRGVLGGSEGSILDTYKGEYKFDGFQVHLYTRRGEDRGVVIRYGKNLTDLKQEENFSKVYTGVLPYWKGVNEDEEDVLVELPEVFVPTEGTYTFTNIYTMDMSSEFETQPTVEELRIRTQRYIKDNEIGTPTVSLTVSFAQLEQTEEYKHLASLERVELFDTIKVEFPEMNVSATAKVCQTNYNVLTGRYSSVTIGNVRSNISSTIINQGEEAAQIAKEEAKSAAKSAVNAQTQADIFNKLTDNGKNQGVYMSDGLVYINASYMRTGIISDAAGMNSWNLTTGDFTVRRINAYGSFQCGEYGSADYTMLNTKGQLAGYNSDGQIGFVDFSASSHNPSTLKLEYGLQMHSNAFILIDAPRMEVAKYSDGSAVKGLAYTGIIPVGTTPNVVNGLVVGYYTPTEGIN